MLAELLYNVYLIGKVASYYVRVKTIQIEFHK